MSRQAAVASGWQSAHADDPAQVPSGGAGDGGVGALAQARRAANTPSRYPAPVRIRHHELSTPLALAPMEGVTDLAFRRLIRRIGGCGLFTTEFISGSVLARDIPRAREMAAYDEGERPIAIQLYGRDPAWMAQGARLVQELGADILDLNMGCPSKKVCANSGGSALMKEPALAAAIVRAMRAAVQIPFTVKMRAGWDPDHRNAPEMAAMCESEGVEAITVHWRTRSDLFGGERELDTIRAVVDRVRIPVIANGDIVDVPTALDTMAKTGAAGLMIGRGAVRDPWIFRKVEAALAGSPVPEVALAEREAALVAYFEDVVDRMKPQGAIGRMKKIARWYTEGLPDGAALRQTVFHCETPSQVFAEVRGWFAEQGSR